MCLGYAHTQLSSIYLLSTFGASHVRKNTRLSTPAQLQCSRSGAWEPGNEATHDIVLPPLGTTSLYYMYMENQVTEVISSVRPPGFLHTHLMNYLVSPTHSNYAT